MGNDLSKGGAPMRSVAAALLALACTAPLQAEDKFTINCSLPFEDIAEHHAIDTSCRPQGNASDTNPGQLGQNTGKNNFCAPGPPALVTRKSFVGLQSKADAADIHGTPADRSGLRSIYTTTEHATIGEGSLVAFAGFILEAHHSNVDDGESVNCNKAGRSRNDIHIVLDELSTTKKPGFCRTIGAEVSPHFRPEDWDTGVLEGLRGRPVRFTGNLFYDGFHRPCVGTHKAKPARVSSWEIHPVYAIDVCAGSTRLKDCPADDDAVWTPLSEFVLADEDSDPE